MKADEYDEFIVRPHRLLSAQISAAGLPAPSRASRNSPICPACTISAWSAAYAVSAGRNCARRSRRSSKAAEEVDRLAEHHADFTEHMTALGFPTSHISTSVAPYDLIADYFRGATGMMKDLYRKKDKLLQLLDKACTFLPGRRSTGRKASGQPDRVHPDPLGAGRLHVAEAVRDLLVADFPQADDRPDRGRHDPDAAVGSGLHQAAGDDQRHPAGQMHLLVRAHRHGQAFEVLGDVVALRGNISPSLMTTGKPEEVDAAVRHLADNVFHKGGKLILDGAFGIPDETPVENVRAMFAAARKYAS